MSWDALFLPFAEDVLAQDVLVVTEPLPAGQCGTDDFARLILSEAALDQAARAYLPRFATWLEGIPHACAVTDINGVVLHSRESDGLERRLFPESSCLLSLPSVRAAAQSGRITVIDPPDDPWCSLLIPLSAPDVSPLGVLAFACSSSQIDRAVAASVVLGARVMAAAVAMQHAQQHTERVLGMIGHELRQPLAALVTALDLLGRSSPVAQKPWEVAHRQTVQLMHLINALLDVSRMMAGKLRMTRRLIDLRRVLFMAAESVRADVAARDQRLDVRAPSKAVWCLGDPVRLQQVIVNLLANANRYTPDGGTITAALEDGDSITLTVSDTGPGVDPGAEDRIFLPFMQERGMSQGLGLGLPITRGIVHMHGGRISVDKRPEGTGARFVVRLPGGLERTREVRNAVMRTRAETRMLVERTRMLRSTLETHRRERSV